MLTVGSVSVGLNGGTPTDVREMVLEDTVYLVWGGRGTKTSNTISYFPPLERRKCSPV